MEPLVLNPRYSSYFPVERFRTVFSYKKSRPMHTHVCILPRVCFPLFSHYYLCIHFSFFFIFLLIFFALSSNDYSCLPDRCKLCWIWWEKWATTTIAGPIRTPMKKKILLWEMLGFFLVLFLVRNVCVFAVCCLSHSTFYYVKWTENNGLLAHIQCFNRKRDREMRKW